MNEPEGQEPDAILAAIEAASAEMDAHEADVFEARKRRDNLIRAGLEAGIAGPVLAKAAGFKRHQRIYQIAASVGAKPEPTQEDDRDRNARRR